MPATQPSARTIQVSSRCMCPSTCRGCGLLVFEAYYNYAPVDEVANSLLWQLIPLVLVPLLVLQLIQVPLTSSMARRVRRHESDRAALLERTLSVSERERIRIAGDLHDGPVQNLAGVGYALDSVASSVPEQYAILMRRIQDTVHDVIWSLRKLMVDLYPPDLSVGQLSAIIASLAAPLTDQGIDGHHHDRCPAGPER